MYLPISQNVYLRGNKHHFEIHDLYCIVLVSYGAKVLDLMGIDGYISDMLLTACHHECIVVMGSFIELGKIFFSWVRPKIFKCSLTCTFLCDFSLQWIA